MKNNWKEEFDNYFLEKIGKDDGYTEERRVVKDFITSLLEEQKKEVLEEIKKDLLDITKGIDDDGSEYIACQIDYFDIEDLFKRYD